MREVEKKKERRRNEQGKSWKGISLGPARRAQTDETIEMKSLICFD
jgi:hypothetical protein